jgi:hypothetical protein
MHIVFPESARQNVWILPETRMPSRLITGPNGRLLLPGSFSGLKKTSENFKSNQEESSFFFFAFVFFKYSLLLRCRLVSDTVHSTQKQHDSEQKYTGP